MEDQSPKLAQKVKKKTFWQQAGSVLKNPIAILSDKTKDSPLVTILAIVFILQPVISSSVGLIKDMIEVKQSLDPGNRPVTKDELEIVNQKIDFIQKLIVTDMEKDAANADARSRRHPAIVAAAPPPASPPTAAVVQQPSVASKPATGVDSKIVDTVGSTFRSLNKRLEIVQEHLDVQYMKNAAKK
jgi:hypothetical protein